MKSLIMKIIGILAILIPFGEVFGAGAVRGVVLYDEPPATYVVALEFVTIRTTSVAFVTVTLPDGRKQELPRSGVVAVIDYPPEIPGGSLAKDAATATRNIQALSSKYPQCAVKLNAALTKWTNAVAFYQQKQKAATPSPSSTPSQANTLEIGGVKYTNVTLKSFDGGFIDIEHAAGFARIPAIQLKPEQIAMLNTTSSAVRIDPTKIAAATPKAAATPPVRGDPTKAAATSLAQIPEKPIDPHTASSKPPEEDFPDGFARIGSPIEEFMKRYGKPIKKWAEPAPCEAEYDFGSKGIRINVGVLNGVAASVVYEGYALTDEQAGALLRKNGNGANWIHNDPSLLADKYPLARADHEVFANIIMETRSSAAGYVPGSVRAVILITRPLLDIKLQETKSSASKRMQKAEDSLKGF